MELTVLVAKRHAFASRGVRLQKSAFLWVQYIFLGVFPQCMYQNEMTKKLLKRTGSCRNDKTQI